MNSRQDIARYLLMHPAELGRRLGYTDLTDELHGKWMLDMLQNKTDMTLQSHRGSFKTTCLTIVISILMMLDHGHNIIFLRKTDNDIAEVIGQVHRILADPLMQQIYSALTGQTLDFISSSKSELTTSAYTAPRGASQLLGIGINGSLTGKHGDIIITDDIVNLKDRASQAERDHTKAVYMELQNIRNRGGRIINTGTPWHKDDAFTIMPAPQVYDCYSTGLISDEKLKALRESMSPSLFAANYELRHIAAENALFETARPFTDDADFLRDGIAHIDAAFGGEDYTAFTCAARIKDTIYIYGKMWRAHVDTVLDAALADAQRLMCGPVYVETNGDKGYLGREIRRNGHTASMYSERENKYIKISTFLRKWWNNIVFLQGTDADYIAQIMDYTDTAEHDDAPDSAACVCRILDRREQ